GKEKNEILADRSGRWRKSFGDDQSYFVSDGSLVWSIDKKGKARRASETPTRNPLELLLGAEQFKLPDLDKVKPHEMPVKGGPRENVYEFMVGSARGDIAVEARVDQKTYQLRHLMARLNGVWLASVAITAINFEMPE